MRNDVNENEPPTVATVNPTTLPDLDSLFFPNVEFDKSILNTLITEHLVRQNSYEVAKKFQEETGEQLGAEIIEKQMKLRSIVPPQGEINLELALEWLRVRQTMDQTERRALSNQNKKDVFEDLEFRIQKAKCTKMLAEAVQIWKTILDQKPQKRQPIPEVSAFDDVEMNNEEEKSPEEHKLSSAVMQNPTQKDFELACQECCNYAKQNLAPFIWKQNEVGAKQTYQDEVMQIMGCLSFVQVLAVNQKTK